MIQRRIGRVAPNILCICVDGAENGVRYRLYHCYAAEPVCFSEVGELLLRADGIFDETRYPQASTESRTFGRKQEEKTPRTAARERIKLMSENEVTNQRGDKATFVVHVQYRQNATWQGSVVWAEKNKTQRFRSALELLKLIDSALDESSIREE